jgi:hypothetical protein
MAGDNRRRITMAVSVRPSSSPVSACLAPAVAIALGATLVAQSGTLPPAYPRPGAEKILDNARVQVWDISWLKQQYPLHRHRYALAGVYYSPGDRTIISQDGTHRPVSTKAWDTAFQAAGVTHIEQGASDAPLRALFVEMKEAGPSGQVDSSSSPAAFSSVAGMPFVDNDRVSGWLLQSGHLPGRHRHQRDAVVLWFDGEKHGAEFITRGTAHDAEPHASGDHVYVFELK